MVVSERAPAAQNASQHDVIYDVGHSSTHVQPCRAGLTLDYQSEGEEDDLFLDVPEPSVLPRPTDAYELNHIRVNNRQSVLTLLQRVFHESETTQPHEAECTVETSAVEEVPKLFGLAVKALPTPTLARLQEVAFALQTVEERSEERPASEVIET